MKACSERRCGSDESANQSAEGSFGSLRSHQTREKGSRSMMTGVIALLPYLFADGLGPLGGGRDAQCEHALAIHTPLLAG